jgi:integrase
MATVTQRTWKVPGQRTRRKAWGYVGVEDSKHRTDCSSAECRGCRQVRMFKSEWSREDAEKALAEFKLKIVQPTPTRASITFAEAVERYLAAKARKKSRDEDARLLGHLMTYFGKDTPISEITAGRISEYRGHRLALVRKIGDGERRLAAATINRPLALLRHLLRLAREEWEVISDTPTIRLEREPQGRIRWLEPDEEARLLDACAQSRTKHLAAVVRIAMETGLRKGELLSLTWEQVDFARGFLRLEVTKSGRRREVPMRQAVYDVLAALPRPHTERVWPAAAIRTAFENAVAAAKLDAFHFHDLRHHFASWFVMRGGSLQALQTILGHQTLQMTLRYAHLSKDHLRSEMSKTETTAQRTQERTHEAVALVGVLQKLA